MNTKISYMYRDKDNYKAHRDEVLSGMLTAEQKKAIFDKCEDSLYFVPDDIGLDPLYEELQKYDRKARKVDHPIHELFAIEDSEEEQTLEQTAQEIFTCVMELKVWNFWKEVGHILKKK